MVKTYLVNLKTLPSYIYQALLNLGGSAELSPIYAEVKALRLADGYKIPKTF